MGLSSAGAILEIGLRVGVNPLSIAPQRILLTIFLSFHSQRVQKHIQTPLRAAFRTKLCLVHCLDWFEDIK